METLTNAFANTFVPGRANQRPPAVQSTMVLRNANRSNNNVQVNFEEPNGPTEHGNTQAEVALDGEHNLTALDGGHNNEIDNRQIDNAQITGLNAQDGNGLDESTHTVHSEEADNNDDQNEADANAATLLIDNELAELQQQVDLNNERLRQQQIIIDANRQATEEKIRRRAALTQELASTQNQINQRDQMITASRATTNITRTVAFSSSNTVVEQTPQLRSFLNNNNNSRTNANSIVHNSGREATRSVINTPVTFNAPVTKSAHPLPSTSTLQFFSGKEEEDLDEWQFELERYFYKTDMGSRFQVDFSVDYLRGSAKQFYRSIPGVSYMAWSDFIALMRQNYEPKNKQEHYRIRLEELKQTNSIEEYIRKFDAIAIRIRNMSDYDMMRHFTKNLKPRTRELVEASDPNDIYEAKSKALRTDTSDKQEKSDRSYNHNRQPYHQRPQPPQQFATQSYQQRPQPQQQSAPSQYAPHTFQQRPQPPQQFAPSQYVPQATTTQNPENKCRSCGMDWKPGHRCSNGKKAYMSRAFNATLVPEKGAFSLIKLLGNLNGSKVICIIDTGATNSIISSNIVNKLNLPVSDQRTMIALADGSKVKANSTAELDFTLAGKISKMKFLITDLTAGDALVGLDWLSSHNAWIHASKRTIYFLPNMQNIISITKQEPIVDSTREAYVCIAASNNAYVTSRTIDDDLIDEIEWPDNSHPSFTVPKDLAPAIRSKLQAFLTANLDRFAKNSLDLGTCTVGKIKIETLEHKPIFRKPFSVPDKQLPLLKKCINEMVEAGVIRPARHSFYAAPVLFVPKKNGEFRFCVSFTDLNKVTIPDHFPLPNINDILRQLKSSKYFSLIDLKSGFWQIPMDESSIHKTTFIVPWGVYECLKMPFGLKNNPSEFSRIMYMILGDLDFVIIYIDDITVHSQTIEEHFSHLNIVFQRLKEANLKLNPKKCVWFRTDLNLLGHNVSAAGIRMDERKIMAVQNFPIPTTLLLLLCFLGMTGYYRRFIKNYASIVAPLQQQLKKDLIMAKSREKPELQLKKHQQKRRLKTSKLEWTEECDKAFKLLKQKITEDPILAHFDPELPIILHTDACHYASGGIMSQIHQLHKSSNNKSTTNKNGTIERVVSFNSRLFDKAELNYPTSEKECQAIVDCVKSNKSYLVGNHFKVFTDHIAIISVFKLKDPHGKLMRMRLFMQGYDMEVLFRKGKVHTNADAVSRLINTNYEVLDTEALKLDFSGEVGMTAMATFTPDVSSSSSQIPKQPSALIIEPIIDEQELPVNNNEVPDDEEESSPINQADIYNDEHLLHYVKKGKHLNNTTTRQKERAEKLAQHYVHLNPVIYYRIDTKTPLFPYIVPPKCVRAELIDTAHRLGHFQVKSTVERLRKKYYWSKMWPDVQNHVDRCHPCIRHEPKPEMHHRAHAIDVESVGDMIAIDLNGPLVITKRGNKYICVIIEYVTKIAFANPIKSKTAEDVAEILWIYISIYGPPKVLLSDQGTEFCNATIRQLTLVCGIDHRITSPYHPNTNGLVERFNQTLVKALKKFCEDSPEEWDRWLHFVLLAYNTRKNSTTGYTPYSLMYGRIMNEFEDYRQDVNVAVERRVKEIKTQYEDLVEDAKNNIRRRQIQQKHQTDTNRKVTEERMQDGQLVTIKSLKLAGKLQPKYHGTYKIIGSTKHGNYRLENMDGTELKQSFVPERLKKVAHDLVENDANAHVEIEKILGHRKRKNRYEYLVKWAGQSEEENSWEPEGHFDTIEIIEEYWSSINKTPIATLASTKFSSLINIVSALLILSATLSNVNAIRIKDSFRFCEIHDNKAIWALPESCTVQDTPMETGNNKYYVLSKLTNEVDGRGWYCTVTHRFASTHMSWGLTEQIFGQYQEHRELTKEDCAEMVRTKRCRQNIMSCANEYCASEKTPEFVFSFFRTANYEWDECEIYKQTVEAENAKSRILSQEHMLTSCTPNDEYCKLPKGILIWDKEIIRQCPYALVRITRLVSYNNILVSESENKLFQVIKNTTICDDIEGLETAEGFFLTKDHKSHTLNSTNNSIKIIDELLLTEIDYQKMSIMKLIIHLYTVQNTKLCQLYKSFINIYAKVQDEFFLFSDFNGNEAVLYSNEGQLFIPKCITLSEIQLIGSTKKCYRDIPVRIRHADNSTSNVFLTRERVIRSTSNLVPCKNNFNSVHLPSSHRIVIMRENNTKVTDDSKYKHITINLQHANVTSFNYQHDEKIITSINIIKKASKIAITDEGEQGAFHVKEDYQSDVRNDLNSILERINTSIIGKIENWMRTVASYSGSIGFIILAVFLTRTLYQRRQQKQ